MRVAVTSTGPNLDSLVDPRLGRALYFVVVDPDTMEFEAHPNPGVQMGSGAGITAVQFVTSLGVNCIITGHVGPNALQALQAAGIRILAAPPTTVREAVEAYKRGELPEGTPPPPGGSPFGPGPGRHGWGGGFGKGGGFGRGGGFRRGGGGFGRGGATPL